MPIYYFNVRAGSALTLDEDGAEFPDAAAAVHEARIAVLELAKDRLRNGLDAISIDTCDSTGRAIATVTASVSIECL